MEAMRNKNTNFMLLYGKRRLPNATDEKPVAYFNTEGTRTGRLSSREPNNQYPPLSERAQELREAFRPKSGQYFMNSNFSQLEIRLAAALLAKADDGSEKEKMKLDFSKCKTAADVQKVMAEAETATESQFLARLKNQLKKEKTDGVRPSSKRNKPTR
jgi:CRISPR/Cas system-associated endonuclease Cas1